MPHQKAHSAMNEKMKACIEQCLKCSTVCADTTHYCLEMGGAHAEIAHVTALLDCAEICQTNANFMSRGSASHKETCRTCAQVCRACEKSCRDLGGAEMIRCADECARCAESCERMAGSAGK